MFSTLNPALGFVAGALTILSPCVLPLLPVVLGSAARQQRSGAFYLISGLVLSVSIFGFAVAAFGVQLGLDSELMRKFGSIMLIILGTSLLSGKLSSLLFEPVERLGHHMLATKSGDFSQFLTGILLGFVWTPCIGPTLGAAIVAAAAGEDLFMVALVMFCFAAGIGCVLTLIVALSQKRLIRWQKSLRLSGQYGRTLFGIILVCIGISTLSNFDRKLSTLILLNIPEWLVGITERY